VTRRLTAPRARAVAVLREVLERGARASPLVTEQSTDLTPENAGLLRELVLGVLRWKTALDSEIQAASRAPLERLAPDLREILEIALYQIRHLDRVPAYAAVDEAVRHARASGSPRAAGFVNAVLRNLQRGSNHKSQITSQKPTRDGPEVSVELARNFSHPAFLVSRWIDRFGLETTMKILEADNRPSPLDLMINSRRAERETLQRALEAEGVATETASMSPLALTVRGGNPLRSPLWAAGHFTIQDLGSQSLPLLLPAGERLVDLAAAPGGKSFAAIALRRVRRAISLDRSLDRLRLLDENRKRLGMPEAMLVAADALALPLPPERFERVLFDAPCSGTGTLRKNPEIRYRITPEAIARLARAQEEALAAAAGLLAPGGYLLYSTCSLEREENEEVVDRVRARIPGLELAAIEAPEGLAPFVAGSRFQTLPSATSDGFTAHLLRRAAG
jgi:16S rRNA (cytosine967-C5)-methyltransferase